MRANGQRYFERGRVRVANVEPQRLTATVYGTHPYEVRVDWSEAVRQRMLECFCSCPYFAGGGNCKHVYATLLAADARQLGGRVPGGKALHIVSPQGDELDEAAEDLLARLQVGGVERPPPSRGKTKKKPSAPPKWKRQLAEVADYERWRRDRGGPGRGPRRREVWYLLDVNRSDKSGRLTVQFYRREAHRRGAPGRLRPLRVSESELDRVPDKDDREVLGMLLDGARSAANGWDPYAYAGFGPAQAVTFGLVRPALYDVALPRLAAHGHFGWARPGKENHEFYPLAWDAGPAYGFELTVTRHEDRKSWRVGGVLRRNDERIELTEPLLLLGEGLVVFRDRVARLEAADTFAWISLLRRSGPFVVPHKDRNQFLDQLWQMPSLPDLELPEELRLREVGVEPQPRITIFAPAGGLPGDPLAVDVAFDYGGNLVSGKSVQAGIVDREHEQVYVRDQALERQRLAELEPLGFREPAAYAPRTCHFQLAPKQLPAAVARLTASGWLVEAEGRKVHRAGDFRFQVSSGVDWFDLTAHVDFGGVKVALPKLLEALRRGEQFVDLADGSRGLLPEEWLARYAPLAEMGEQSGDAVRFRTTQAALLDALLAAQPQVDFDQGFAAWRERLRRFEGVRPATQPPGFVGQLRHYQEEGLGWLDFLQEFRFGGCLADDMGLGKTIQVLALLEERRTRTAGNGAARRPSLVVVPRSLVHNWIEEAGRFAPQLRVLNYTGLGRTDLRQEIAHHDLVVTTYGTLRRDIPQLKDATFDYAILDEAQAIKNPESQAAKACRLVCADHRLAMTGTPIENRLAELWSIFEFLNPGMLGRSASLKAFSANGADADPAALQLLARALRPFILRRTKEQVLQELPEKTEQTLWCELDAEQQKLYDELREHFRASLAKKIEELGIARAKIHVLEALLRLRQAACHPGLLDESRIDGPSAKLEALIETLHEVLAEGHKALVFSQFTSLLAIVRRRLDAEGIVYEYLDGKTRNRKERVDRFQQDAACPLFLISLKAGGLGLNLTAADYVFILDPWWNPAVEAQAVDRTHRIGQSKPVFAYRLIASGTVEEKIMELQATKRQLADAIITADNSLIGKLSADDLKLLLS